MKKLILIPFIILTLFSCSPEDSAQVDSAQVETQDSNLSVSDLAASVTYWESIDILTYAFKYDNDGVIKIGQALLEGECVRLTSDDINITAMFVSDEAIVLNYGALTTVTFTVEGDSLKHTINVDGSEISEVMTPNNTPPCEDNWW
tara:strand:+ start:42 stop:479 length:438 start_codon:yes stop_codon:yes gene_type:complete